MNTKMNTILSVFIGIEPKTPLVFSVQKKDIRRQKK